jgi:hypothetical protein
MMGDDTTNAKQEVQLIDVLQDIAAKLGRIADAVEAANSREATKPIGVQSNNISWSPKPIGTGTLTARLVKYDWSHTTADEGLTK